MIQDFMRRAVAAQLKTAGELVTISRPKTKETYNITCVLTSRDGSLTAEAGGIIHAITAHALIPCGELYKPAVGDRLTSGEDRFMIISVIRSPQDGAFSCDLIAVQK